MIRPWVITDNSTVERIEKDSFSDAWTREMLDGCFSSPAFYGFVYEEQGVVYGYVGLICSYDAEIALIAVDVDKRRQGIGEKLLSKAVTYAKEKGAENVFLEVRKSNLSAQALYAKMGFITITLRKKYYPDGEDAIIMVLPMTNQSQNSEV